MSKPEIEVTPEMAAIGAALIADWEQTADYSYERLAMRVYRAMAAASGKQEIKGDVSLNERREVVGSTPTREKSR